MEKETRVSISCTVKKDDGTTEVMDCPLMDGGGHDVLGCPVCGAPVDFKNSCSCGHEKIEIVLD